MKISFIISTFGDQDFRINSIIDSIESNSIPEYEIIVVGGLMTSIDRKNTWHLPFDEDVRTGWITKKKNLASLQARYDALVVFHDYHVFANDWYWNMVKFGYDWDIQMNAIKTIHGQRMLDWVIFDHPYYPRHAYVPYERTDLVPYQYISGGFFVAKRHVMMEELFNENLLSHQEEDVEWSKRVRDKFKIVMNPNSIVTHNKIHRDFHLCKERSRYFGVPYE